jgi:serine/threonine-protein kinase
MDESRFTIPSGAVLGRYEIESPISSGSMGAVYRAHNTETGMQVAVKHVLDTRHSERFEVEARLLAMLSHPRVVKVLDYLQDDAGQYLVMELVNGIDLNTLLSREGGPGLPLEQALGYVREACEALQYVHDQQIVHRDVKPHNLILSDRGVVLVDFGVARLLADGGDEEQGTVGIGTPRFMAPEVFAGGAVSARSDVFSIAATLWTLLAGKPPVYAGSARLTDLAPGIPPEIDDAIQAGLEMIPERRLTSIAVFARVLGGSTVPVHGRSLARSVELPPAERALLEAIVRTAAGVFQAAASSIALTNDDTGELVYQSAWGAGAREIVGVRLPVGKGIAGSVVQTQQPVAVTDCRNDARFQARIAQGTGYVPYTMLVVPLLYGGRSIGALSLLDRRDGMRYEEADTERAGLFAELTVTALESSRQFGENALAAETAVDPF